MNDHYRGNNRCISVKYVSIIVVISLAISLYALWITSDSELFNRIYNLYPMVKMTNCKKDIEQENFQLYLLNRWQNLVDLVDGKFKRLESEIKNFDTNISSRNMKISSRINHDRTDIKDMGNYIWAEMIKRTPFDDADFWRKTELAKLTEIIQKRIYKLQNPSDCKVAKKINCIIYDNVCGFGCEIHSISYCLIVGYSTKRVVLPVLDKWRYSPNGWNGYFLPLTKCTLNDTSNEGKNKTKNKDDIEVLDIPFYQYPLPTLPPAFPTEFAETLTNLHPDPSLFWLSQFVHYATRKTPNVHKYIQDKNAILNISSPIAGIHIRQTDKINHEAESFKVEEYMKHVSTWFDLHFVQNGSRHVYLATDEPAVINEAVSKYPDYNFLFNKEGAVRAKNQRYTNASLLDIVTSLDILTNCDFVVCTFSSNVCRLVYELMQIVKNGDFTNSIISLDTIYYYYGQQNRQQIAIMEHKPEVWENNEIELNIDDILIVDLPQIKINLRNQFDGFTFGKNLRTKKSGRYPTYKVKEKWQIVDFPKYL